MGCGSSIAPEIEQHAEMKKSEKAMKAALLIQGWYRRYQAQVEIRRRYTWSIFQSIEYSGEQNQLKLYNFFNDMLHHLTPEDGTGTNAVISNAYSGGSGKYIPSDTTSVSEEEELYNATNPDDITVDESYNGPHIKFPLTHAHLQTLIKAFKGKKQLHAKYVMLLLHNVRKVFKKRATIMQASTSLSKKITVCGDLHGNLDDLFTVFYKNGLPSVDNPYIFNGDFVDRGSSSIEVAMVLFACVLTNPNEVYINRGNHEDHVMNLRYGFIKEIMKKYKDYATRMVRLFEDVFSWLPLATVIDQKVLVTHGGISDKVDLNQLAKTNRHKYLSILRPPIDAIKGLTKIQDLEDEELMNELDNKEKIELMEWRQVLDILWSDPRTQSGCSPNTFRGGGTYFGPDVTREFLKKHNLQLLIRSHECKPEGFEYTHNDQVLTIFSASNYYEVGSNKGAYVKLRGPDLDCTMVQYMAALGMNERKITFTKRISVIEASALEDLRERIITSQTALINEFKKFDSELTGKMRVADWCQVMDKCLEMDLPWLMLRSKLVKCADDGMILYNTLFEEMTVQFKNSDSGPTMTEMLYKNKDNLETIFRMLDKDNSGYISMEEFEDGCKILSKHINGKLELKQVRDLAKSIDINNDGQIDFNEFLEAFRIVDKQGQAVKKQSNEKVLKGDKTVKRHSLKTKTSFKGKTSRKR